MSYICYIQNNISVMNSNRPTSYTKLNNQQKISRINRRLRMGDISKVAQNTGYSPNYTSEVLSGKYQNQRIINEAYDLTRGRMSNTVKLSQLS